MSESLKVRLHQACLTQVKQKIATLEAAIADAQQAASEDTKSSAGDKFETSREMMKLEIDKASSQLSLVLAMQEQLRQLRPDVCKDRIGAGSLVTTNEGMYYFSVSLGKIVLEDVTYYALSLVSPLGKALLHHEKGDRVDCMGRTIEVIAVV